MTTLTKPAQMLLRRLRADDGVALIMAVSIVMVLSIATAASIEIVRAGQVNSSRERQTSRALAIGEAGIDKGLAAVVAADPNAHTADRVDRLEHRLLVRRRQRQLQRDEAERRDAGTSRRSPRSPDGKVTRRVETTVQPQPDTTGTAVSPVYGYGFFMADPTRGLHRRSRGTGNSIGNSALR